MRRIIRGVLRAVGWSIPLSLAAILSTACEFKGQASQAVVRDSAGIEIVENLSPTWTEGEGWWLSADPVLTIGVLEGPEEYQFFDVLTALRLEDGEIVVAMRSTSELRFYDSLGTFLHSVGREGGGPGEFRAMMEMWRYRTDSLAVFDYGNARVTVLSRRGEFARTFRFDQVPNRALPLPVGPFADGSFLGRSHMSGTESEKGEGVYRDSVLYVRWTSAGTLVDTLVRRPDSERYHGRTATGRSMMASPPFARDSKAAVSPDGWYYGATDEFEIEQYSPVGPLRRLIRRVVANRPVTAEHAEERRLWALERYGRMPADARDWRANLPVPETMPAYDAIATDDDGNLWVAEYRLPAEQPSWAVFDVDGRFLGNVDTPVQGLVTHIGSDFILGIWKGDMEVEQVRVYRLRKNKQK